MILMIDKYFLNGIDLGTLKLYLYNNRNEIWEGITKHSNEGIQSPWEYISHNSLKND